MKSLYHEGHDRHEGHEFPLSKRYFVFFANLVIFVVDLR